MKVDIEMVARFFSSGLYNIKGVYRLVIQPQSQLRNFHTLEHGLLFVVNGSAKMVVEGTNYMLQPGSLLHAAPNMLLGSEVLGNAPFEYYSVFYQLDDAAQQAFAAEPIFHNHFSLEGSSYSRTAEMLRLLHRHARAADEIEMLRVKELFCGVLYQVLKGSQHNASSADPAQKLISEAADYIHGHYMNTMTLQELAALHGMNEKRFAYYFHKYMGSYPIDYLIQYRLERASELLRTGQFAVHDVAISVGYANPLYFSRAFKRKFGMSPSDYMNQCSKYNS